MMYSKCFRSWRRLALGMVAVLMVPALARAVETPTSSGAVSVLDVPIIRIPRMKEAPTIDGVMNEKEWEDSSAVSGFWYDYAQSKFVYLAPMQTQLQVYVGYDDEHLYFAYSSPVWPEDSWLKAHARFPDVIGHPQYGMQWDDHIELEFRPIPDNVEGFRKGLFRWDVNPIGTMADFHWTQAKGANMRWQSKARTACNVTGQRWTMEISIPLVELRQDGYAETDAQGRQTVAIPPPDGTTYRCWFTRGIGGNGAFFNAYDAHIWNTTKTKLIFDSKAPSFQINELGPIMEDTIDVRLTVKNHNDRSETVRLGFFVESAEGNIYSSYADEELTDGLLELVPGEVRELRLRKKFPGITTEGNTLWFDVRSAGEPAKPILQTRLINFHSMEGGRVRDGDNWVTFRWRRIEVIKRLRPPRKEFEFWYTYSCYKGRMSAVVDKGIYGASEEAKSAVEAKLTVMEAGAEEATVAEETVPFHGNFATLLFDMPKLDSGDYKVSLLLFDGNRRIVGEANPEPFYVGRFEWVNNDAGTNDVVWEPFTPLEPDDDGFDTLKHRFTLSDSGLPAQIRIKPDVRDVPLEHRDDVAKTPTPVLEEVGRGDQLREGVRFEAIIDGKRVPAEVVEPAKLVRTWKSELEYASKLRAGPVDIDLTVQYDCDGAMTVDMNYHADEPVTIDGLEMLADFNGMFDLVVSALKGGGMAGGDSWEMTLPDGEGVVWDSADVERPQLYYSHFMPWLFFGSADRAFTWICDSDRYWGIDREGSTMTLERNEPGQITWRVKFVNEPTEIAGDHPITWMLLTHPAKPKPKDFRRLSYFLRGDRWGFVGWGPKFGTDEQFKKQWRFANQIPKDVPDSERATYVDTRAPWNRYYQLRGDIPAIPATIENALTGDLFGRMGAVAAKVKAPRIVDGEEKEVEIDRTGGGEGVYSGGGMCNMGRAWQDLFAWNFGRLMRLGRYHGWWWDETWPTYRSSNLAAGEAYLRDPEEVRENELPWQDQFLTMTMRGMFKRLARQFAEEGVPLRNSFWANNSATAFESFGYDTCLVEDCSSDHRSFELDNVVVFPNSMFKYNSHNYSGLVARLVERNGWPNMIVSRPGDDKRLDRQMFGRALLNDIGMEYSGPHGRVQHNDQALRFINALIDFGYFEADGKTEFLPYWRNADYVHYGEKWSDDDAFATTEENPYGKVYVSVFRRPVKVGNRSGYKAMFLIMNESDDPVRERLIIPNPQRIFGGPNRLTGDAVIRGRYDFSAIEDITAEENWSDWSGGRIAGDQSGRVLEDLEDHGLVAENSSKGREGEVYGPVYVLPHNYRLLYGYWVK